MRQFEEKGIATDEGELTKLHVMDTWVPEDLSMLSRAEKVRALSSLMCLKEKRSGKVNVRACVNGGPHISHIRKEDASSPTVAN